MGTISVRDPEHRLAYAAFVNAAEALVDAGRDHDGDIDFDLLAEVEAARDAYVRLLKQWARGEAA